MVMHAFWAGATSKQRATTEERSPVPAVWPSSVVAWLEQPCGGLSSGYEVVKQPGITASAVFAKPMMGPGPQQL
jgi:hypothetical protein